MKTKVLITAGPTRAYLDDVRYLSNFSTGSLGYFLAKELVQKGAEVYVVAGPTAMPFHKLRLKKFFPIETNEEMLRAVLQVCKSQKIDWAIFSAAVLDFVPTKKRSGKVSSKTKSWTIALKPTPKIIDVVGKRYPKIKKVGFKLEWDIKKGKALDSFAGHWIDRRKLQYLLVNFLPQIHGEKHRAMLFDRDLRHITLTSKSQIAKEMARALKNDFLPE